MVKLIDPATVQSSLIALSRAALSRPAVQGTLRAFGAAEARFRKIPPQLSVWLAPRPHLTGAAASFGAIAIFLSAAPSLFHTRPTIGPAITPVIERPIQPSPPADRLLPFQPKTPPALRPRQSSAAPDPKTLSRAPDAAPSTAPARPSAEPKIASTEGFRDRFAGLDEGRWYVADRGSNGAWCANDFRRTQTTLSPQGLNLTLAASAAPQASSSGQLSGPAAAPRGATEKTRFSSGEIGSKQRFKYGYFEARLRAPRGQGLDTGLFTFVRDKGVSTWNEIDVEIIGRNTRRVELAIHMGKDTTHQIVDLPFDAADGFHTYAFDWRPGVVRWYIDNALVFEDHGPNAAGLTRAQNLYVDVWGSETLSGWLGKLDAAAGPYTLTVACTAHAKSYEGRSLCAE